MLSETAPDHPYRHIGWIDKVLVVQLYDAVVFRLEVLRGVPAADRISVHFRVKHHTRLGIVLVYGALRFDSPLTDVLLNGTVSHSEWA